MTPARLAPITLLMIGATACERTELLIGRDGQSSAGAAGSAGSSPDAPASIGAILAQMPPDSWRELPGTAMTQVCPPGATPGACSAVMSAWSGAAFDEAQDRLFVFGGGGEESYVNSLFSFDLATGRWTRWTDLPAPLHDGQIPDAFRDPRIESCGLYPSVSSLQIPDEWLTPPGQSPHQYLQALRCDEPAIQQQLDAQQPRSAHSFGNVAFSPLHGVFYLLGTQTHYPSGQALSTIVWGFHIYSRRWVRYARNLELGAGCGAADARGHVWYVGREQGNLNEFDPETGLWSLHQAPSSGSYHASSAIDEPRHHLVLTQDASHLTVYDLQHPDLAPQHPGPPWIDSAPTLAPGFAYLPTLDRFVAWLGGRSLRWLHPATWTWTEHTAPGDDPGPPAPNGTFGRLRYSPRSNVLIVVSDPSSNVFLYRPPTSL